MFWKYYKAEVAGVVYGVASLERGTKDYAWAILTSGYPFDPSKVVVDWHWALKWAEEDAEFLRADPLGLAVSVCPVVRTDRLTFKRVRAAEAALLGLPSR